MSTHEVLKVRLCNRTGCEEIADQPAPMPPRRRNRAGEAGAPERWATGDQAERSSFEFKAAAPVDLGRRVDAALVELEPAQARYEEACRRWRRR
jgi:hypothetical protein